jgi:hypothetical protein
MTDTLTVSGLVEDASALMGDYSAVIGAAAVIGLGAVLLRRLISAAR